ncbi:MAG: C40 family peptidase [Clostridiaceae bacterium]|nr:C40 family peptidase [Clostridiaceae bacterium]
MENTNIIRRCSEILAALIVVFSTIVFIYTNTRHLISAYDVLSASKAKMSGGIEDRAESSSSGLVSESIAPETDESISGKSSPEITENTVTETYTGSDTSEAAAELSVESAVEPAEITEPVYKYVQVNLLNLRRGPSSDTELLGTLPQGTQVQVLESHGEWLKVLTPEKKEVYVFAEYVADTKPPVYNYVNVNLLNVRSGPGSEHDIVTTIPRGTRVQVLEQYGEWMKVIVKDNMEAFVYAPYLVASQNLVARAESAQPYNQSLASQIIEYAKQFVGVPYVYGGSSPKGFDCSGFTKYVFGKFKISLPRSADDYASVGVKVSRSDLKPGDILLFDRYDNGRLGHVGIYLGNDQFIHASSSKKKVVIMRLSEYRAKFLGARRVIK